LSLRPLVRARHASRHIEEDTGDKFPAVSRADGAKSKSMA
jgi:hypothetical protein